MKLSKDIRNLLINFLSNQNVVASWGISNIQIEENSISFTVCGMKYQGGVSVNRFGKNVYDVKMREKVYKSLKMHDVINKIDDYIEHTDNYQEDVKKWLSQKKDKSMLSSVD